MSDATIELPGPADAQPIKKQVYCIRGETIAIGGRFEWTLRVLAEEFAGSAAGDAKPQWEDLKKHLLKCGLHKQFSTEIASVSEYFKVRKLAAHGADVFVSVGSSVQIFRMTSDGPIGGLTLPKLRDECDTARRGYEALQAVGRALDQHDRQVLAKMNRLLRPILLGTD